MRSKAARTGSALYDPRQQDSLFKDSLGCQLAVLLTVFDHPPDELLGPTDRALAVDPLDHCTRQVDDPSDPPAIHFSLSLDAQGHMRLILQSPERVKFT